MLVFYSQVFSDLSPYEQQQTVRYLVDHVVYNDSEMRIALDTGTYVPATKKGAQREFSEPPHPAGRMGVPQNPDSAHT